MRYDEIIQEDAQAADVAGGLFEMANLRQQQTGVPGTIYISTAQASHGPRVKHYAGRPGEYAPYFAVSIEALPIIVEVKGLSEKQINAVSGLLLNWVRLNHEKLHDFWYNGTSWFDNEVTAFKRSLVKVTPN